MLFNDSHRLKICVRKEIFVTWQAMDLVCQRNNNVLKFFFGAKRGFCDRVEYPLLGNFIEFDCANTGEIATCYQDLSSGFLIPIIGKGFRNHKIAIVVADKVDDVHKMFQGVFS